MSQSAEVGSAEGDAPLFSDAVFTYVQSLLPSHNRISSAALCLLSFVLTSLRNPGRLAAEIFF